MNDDQKLIFVTGFGPFVGHEEVNASWEAVKRLPDELDQRYLLKKLEVPVTYKDVDKIVEDIWKQKPYLVVHVGVHGRASRIHIENLAYNHKFDKVDFARKKLDCPTACLKNNDSTCVQINTKLDTDRIANLINELKGCGCNVDTPQFCCTSSDVGNYLCGYIYLKSLDHDPERSLFLHVPVMKVFSSEETSHCILEIIKECINQLEAKNTDNKQQEISL